MNARLAHPHVSTRAIIWCGALIAMLLTIPMSGCGTEPTGPTLTNASPSVEDLVNRALHALRTHNEQELHELRITHYEHDSILAPLTRDSVWMANFDLPLAWSLLDMGCQKGERRALEDYGGDSLAYQSVSYRGPDEIYANGELILHRYPSVFLKDEKTGEVFESRLFGTIMELHGQFKLISIRD